MGEFGAFTSFLSGIGLGGVITFLLKHFLEQKSKRREVWLLDYKASCDGLLDAYREIALSNSDESKKKYAYWELKLQLYASEEVLRSLHELKISDPNSIARESAQRTLLKAMRKDLGFV